MSRWEEFIELNNIGQRFHNVDIKDVLSKYPEKEKLIESFFKEHFSLMFYGPAGRGKTYATLALIRYLLKNHSVYSIRFLKAKIIDDTLTEKSQNFESSRDYLNVLCSTKFLFIDDFGIDKANNKTCIDMYEIIDARWANQLSTIISTNLKPSEIEKIYGERIASRLKSFQKLYFSGKDLREQ